VTGKKPSSMDCLSTCLLVGKPAVEAVYCDVSPLTGTNPLVLIKGRKAVPDLNDCF
jgi:hypothetical protein